jgi:hypothetical protein
LAEACGSSGQQVRIPFHTTSIDANITTHSNELTALHNIWTNATNRVGNNDLSATHKAETARRHTLENYDKTLNTVQALKLKLEIMQRWQSEGDEWQCTGRLVAMRKYQRALDILEGLIVAWMFELTKMNRSQTGKILSHYYFIPTQP